MQMSAKNPTPVRIASADLDTIDELVAHGIAKNRSDFIRNAIHSYIQKVYCEQEAATA